MDGGLEGPAWDALRTEGAWMRRLASALVGDPQAADDLVQEAWLRTVEQRGEGRQTRAWLAGMLRNLARERRRGEERRARRERAAARPEAPPDSDGLGARLELQQRVLDAVRSLPKLQRDAILLRFYDELTPSEIASRLGVPAGTVRARLSRGLAQLRRRLDECSGGDCTSWQLALLPWIASDRVSRSGTFARLAALGDVAMKLGIVVGGLCLALVVGFTLQRTGDPVGEALGPARIGAESSSTDALHEEAELASPRDTPDSPKADREPSSGTRPTRLVARVLDHTRRPLANAWLRLHPHGEGGVARADASGRLEHVVASESGRVLELEVGAPGHASKIVRRQPLLGEVRWIGDVLLGPGASLAGYIVDTAGRPVAGARVCATPVLRISEIERETMELGGSYQGPHATSLSEVDGSFRFEGLPVGHVRIWARSAERRWCYTRHIPLSPGEEREDVTLVLADPDPSDWITGVVLGPDGAVVEGARLRWSHMAAEDMELLCNIDNATDIEGQFELPVLRPGPQRVVVEHPRGMYAPLRLEQVEAGVFLELRFERNVELVVRVIGPHGNPLEAAEVTACVAATPMIEPDMARAETNSKGFARLCYPDDSFFVSVQRTGFQSVRAGPFIPGPRVITLALSPDSWVPVGGETLAGVLEGVLLVSADTESSGYIVRIASEDGTLFERELGPDGHFKFDALRPGAWQLAAFEPEEFVSPRRKARVELPVNIVAGTTTRADLDLSEVNRILLEGRLIVRGAPQGQWYVHLSGAREFVTGELDPEGRFALEFELGEAHRIALRLALEDDDNDHLVVMDHVQVWGERAHWELELPVGLLSGRISSGIDFLVHKWGVPGAGPDARTGFPVRADGSFGPILVPAGPGSLLSGYPEASGNYRDRQEQRVDVPVGGELEVEMR